MKGRVRERGGRERGERERTMGEGMRENRDKREYNYCREDARKVTWEIPHIHMKINTLSTESIYDFSLHNDYVATCLCFH